MAKLIDLTGQRFGRLTVIEKTNSKPGNTNAVWLCRCDCGREVAVRGISLRKGESKSGNSEETRRQEIHCQETRRDKERKNQRENGSKNRNKSRRKNGVQIR